MADEAETFMQRILQDIRSEVRGVREKLGEHDKRFDTLERMIREWQETPLLALASLPTRICVSRR